MNAVIVDLKAEYAAALCENGSIEKIPNAGYEIGQQIEMDAAALIERSRRRNLSKIVRRIGTVAAAFAVVAGLGSGIAYAMPYGTVSLDSEASIEFTINRFNHVIGISAGNEDGSTVLNTIDSSLMHKEIENAVAITLVQIQSDGYLNEETELVISVDTENWNHSEKLAERLDETVEADMSLQAQVVPVAMRDADSAQENQMTTGQKQRQNDFEDETDAEADTQNGAESKPDAAADHNDVNGTQGTENSNDRTDGNTQTPNDETGGNAQATNRENSGNAQPADVEAGGNPESPNGENDGNAKSPDGKDNGDAQNMPNGAHDSAGQNGTDHSGGPNGAPSANTSGNTGRS